MLALEIVEHDAIDAVAGNVEPESTSITDEQFATIQDLIDKTGTDTQALAKHYKVNSIRDLTEKQFKHAVEVLGRKLA